MRSKLFNLFNELHNNTFNSIIYVEGNKRVIKTFKELSADIDGVIERLNFLKTQQKIESVAIIGVTSYQWMLFDLACIKGGFKSIAIPEALPELQVQNIIKDTKPDIILLDYSLIKKFPSLSDHVLLFNCFDNEVENNFQYVKQLKDNSAPENKILEEYSIAFSSGTSEKLKTIILKFNKSKEKPKSLKESVNKIGKYIGYKLSFWSRKDNKLIIFMPFSHPQQRAFVLDALFLKLNVILSNPQNILKDIIVEKPNIMISVPVFYEALAGRIRTKIKNFTPLQNTIFRTFTFFRVNSFSNSNPIKKLFSKILFKDISKIYGGRADFFITGSARIEPEILQIFYRIGVKIFEGYGQTELGIISLNTHKNFRIGSVGKPFLDLKINDESEILVKYEEEKFGHNKSALKINQEGYIQTGDLGYLDKDGFLFLKGRKDDVIVLNNGKKVFSQELEKKIKQLNYVHDCLVFSPYGEKIRAIITTTNKSLASDFLIKRLKEVNGQLSDHEKIESFYLSQELFSPDNGLMTSTFKVKRKTVIDKFKQEEFYRI